MRSHNLSTTLRKVVAFLNAEGRGVFFLFYSFSFLLLPSSKPYPETVEILANNKLS